MDLSFSGTSKGRSYGTLPRSWPELLKYLATELRSAWQHLVKARRLSCHLTRSKDCFKSLAPESLWLRPGADS